MRREPPYLARRLLRSAGFLLSQGFDPLAPATFGIGADQPDEPWWITEIRGWLAMVAQIRQALFRGSDAWRTVLESVLNDGEYRAGDGTRPRGPRAVYAVYADWRIAAERERMRA